MSTRANSRCAAALVVAQGWCLLGVAVAAASPRRLAIVVGNNLGAPHEMRLRFAERDARRLARTLRELGSIRRQDLFLLLGKNADAVRRALARVSQRTKDASPTMLLFYYSGHSDQRALHLGATRLAWSEVRQLLRHNRARLRIALIDSCHAGTLTAAKGFFLGAPPSAARPARGVAMIMAAEADEAAQESIALGGSFFTHYLISALRGAADANGDQRVTLAEARAYATQHTTRATGAWARAVQHPVYHFDIEGHGEIVLTDLREGAARLAFGKDLDGHLVVTEKGSPLVVAESRKRAGRPLRLALPKGRYVAYLRTAKAVKIAEVRLPWGGQATLTCADMTPRSYQSVARKGSRLVVHRHRLRVGGGLQSGILTGMGALGVVRLGYGLNLAPVELGLRFTFSQKTFAAVDTEIDAQVLGGAVLVAYERALSIVDLRGWLVGEGQFWRQVVRRQGERRSGVFGVGFGAGVRVPIVWHLFGEGAVEAMVYFPDEEGSGRIVRPTVAGDLAVGLVF